MKIPRNVYGADLVKALRVLGYEVQRQRGSHITMTTTLNGPSKEVIPNHHPIKTGTLSGILKSIAVHHNLTVEELLKKLDL